jgi:hypothetical protein
MNHLGVVRVECASKALGVDTDRDLDGMPLQRIDMARGMHEYGTPQCER